MNRNYVVVLQAVKLDMVTDRKELAEFAREGNARLFALSKAHDMWGGTYNGKEAKNPSIGTVFYHDKEQYRIELFVQPRLVRVEEFGRASAPQT